MKFVKFIQDEHGEVYELYECKQCEYDGLSEHEKRDMRKVYRIIDNKKRWTYEEAREHYFKEQCELIECVNCEFWRMIDGIEYCRVKDSRCRNKEAEYCIYFTNKYE